MADELAPYVTALTSLFGASRAVYADMVPAGTLPPRYVLVSTSTGEWSSSNASGAPDLVSPSLAVTYVSRDADPARAAKECKWAQRRGDAALAVFRAALGQASWLPEHVTSGRPVRDDSIPEPTVFATSQYVLRYQPS